MTYDVLVAGGGPAGVMAAVAAARAGARVALVERYGFLGGMATAALVLPLMTYHASLHHQIVTGLPQELIDRLIALGASPGHVADPLGFCATITPVDPEYLKFVHQELCLEAGVDLYLHTMVIGVLKEGSQVTGLLLQEKEGPRELRARVVIDCTGDADVAARAGAAFEEGRASDGLSQPMTMMFRIGGVDVAALNDAMAARRDDMVLAGEPGDFPVLGVAGFFQEVSAAKAAGEFPVPRDRVLLFGMPRRSEVIVNMTRITHVRSTQSAGLTRGEIEGRRQVFTVLDFLQKRIPGFQQAYLVQTGTQVGVRESRRVTGLATLTGDDVIAGREWADSVGRGAFPIDIHSPSGGALEARTMRPGTSYDIPYGALVPKETDGLLIAGRCISADHEALASARISATAMALGQAAGTAAALACAAGVQPRQVDPAALQAALGRAGASWGKAAERVPSRRAGT